MSQPETYDVIVLGSGQGGNLMGWHHKPASGPR
jgi:hypothetical protein